MKYDKTIHSISHVIKSVIGNVIKVFDIFSTDQLIVLNYHGTQKKYISNFERQLNYLSKQYQFVSPTDFFKILDGQKKISGKNVLLTFDDGIKNNLNAISILNKRGISAVFFIVPNFIETEQSKQKDYFIRCIRPVINPNIDFEKEDFGAVTWEDLRTIKDDHLIGCHTLSHTMVKNKLTDEELERELIESKQKIENELNINVNTFCSINNTMLTIGDKEFEIISKTYKYHFSTFGGNNLINPNPLLIKRINVESYWLDGAFKFALSSIELNRWKKTIKYFYNTVKN